MGKAVAYLRKIEWSKGSGQCPECSGVPEFWLGHPCHRTADTIGHKKDCTLASALEELGENALFIGDFHGTGIGSRLFGVYLDDA